MESNEMKVKDEMSSEEELREEFVQDVLQTQDFSIIDVENVDDIEIKYEPVDFHSNSSQHGDSEDHSHLDLETVSNIAYADCGSVNAAKKDLNNFYLDLLQCDRDCETCQMYIRMLTSHVRATHGQQQPIQDPLLFDPLHIDSDPSQVLPSPSFIQIKSEVDESSDSDMFTYLLQCEQDCETCQKYMIVLSEHVRAFHVPLQPIQDPLHIDPLNIDHQHHPDPSSLILIKYEMNEGNSKIQYSEELSGSQNSENSFKRDNRCFVGRDFMQSTHFKDQKRTHIQLEEKPFKCDLCEKRFLVSKSLRVHKMIHDGERPHQCDQCEKSFTLSGHLTAHKRIHTGERPFKCSVCEKNFPLIGALNVHMKIHTGERSYKCNQCEKSFSQKNNLEVHKRTHTGERPFQCDQCGKDFARSDKLSTHKRTHTGEKPFMCDVCGKTFTRKAQLVGHKRLHTGDRPHKCNQCGKSYPQKSSLTVHMSTHAGERPFKCDV